MSQQYSADLLALYAAAPYTKIYRCHLFAVGPCRNGTMIYATDGRSPITYNGNVYHPYNYGFWKRGAQTVKIGWESNSIDCTIYSSEQFQPIFFPGTNDMVYLMDGIYAGLLGAASVTIYRATMSTYGTVIGPTGGSLVSTRFVGECGETENLGPTKCTIKVRDLMYRLNLDCPQQLITAPCRWVLYSTGCTLLQSNFTRSAQSISGLIDPRTLQTTAHLSTISAAGTFSKGTITFTSGANNGISYAVAVWTPGSGGTPDQLQLDAPPLFDMNPGDAFNVSEGCNHTISSCENLQPTLFQINFGGMLFVPVPEAAV